MCPMCLAAGSLYVAGGVSAGAVTTFFATKWLRHRTEPAVSSTVDESKGDDRVAADD